MIVQTHRWMNSLGTDTYGSSHVEQGRIAWKSLGNLLAPARAPTSYPHLGFTTESPPPPPLSTVQSLYSPQQPSLKSGRSHQGLALRYGSLAKGGIRQGHSACLCACHHLCCMIEFQHIILGYKNSADMGHFCISVYNAVCRVEAILWGCLAVCLQYKGRQGLLLLLLLGFNGPATEAEPQIIIMRENEIHIRKGEEGKVDKEIW